MTVDASGLSSAGPFAVSEAVAFTELDGEAVLLNVDTGIYYGLDPMGTRVWRLLVAGATPRHICDALLEEFEVEPSRLAHDVFRFLNQLAAEHLAFPVGIADSSASATSQ
jgi:hypothetical protein